MSMDGHAGGSGPGQAPDPRNWPSTRPPRPPAFSRTAAKRVRFAGSSAL